MLTENKAIMNTTLKQRIELLFFVLLCIYGSYNVFAQDVKDQHIGTNELKINMGSLLLEFPEISYEYIINEESSIGISVALPLDRDISYRFIISPNYRIFFGEKRAAGFFIEANSAIFSQRFQRDLIFGSINDPSTDKTKIGWGLGIAVGGKFLTKNGFIGEIYIGGGRNFVNTDEIDGGYPRIGISIGKRF